MVIVAEVYMINKINKKSFTTCFYLLIVTFPIHWLSDYNARAQYVAQFASRSDIKCIRIKQYI